MFDQSKQLLILLIFISFQTNAQAGKVVYVTDGDTFHMQIDGQRTKIRMADIDTPEPNQPYGLEAKAHLKVINQG